MIKLSLPRELYWIDLPHGVRVFVRPLNTAIYETARAKGTRMVAEILRQHAEISLAGGTVEGLPDLDDAEAVAGLSQFLFVCSMASSAIIRWEGVANPDGRALEPDDKSVADLMRFHDVAEAFIVTYARPHHEAVAEGNAFRPSPSGTTAEGLNTAGDAAKPGSPVPAAA